MSLEIWNILNVIGIILEIIGFILMLIQFKKPLVKRIEKKATEEILEWQEEQNKDLEKHVELPKSWKDATNNNYEKRLDWTGIFFVIGGLFFQLLSIFVESFLRIF